MALSSHLPISAHVAPCWCSRNFFFFSLMHPIGPELPISAHVACAHVCRQLYVLRASHALVQATVGVGTVIIVYIGIAYTRGGGGYNNVHAHFMALGFGLEHPVWRCGSPNELHQPVCFIAFYII